MQFPVRWSLCLVVALLFGWASQGGAQTPMKPLTAEQKKKLKERDRYLQESQAFERAGKLPEAIAAAEKMLAIERPIYGNVHPEIVASLEILARLHERREDFAAAKKPRQELLTLQKKLHGPKSWQATDARLDVQDVEQLAQLNAKKRKELKEAEQWLNQAQARYRPGKYKEGAELADKAVAARQRILGTDHRLTADGAAVAGLLWDNAAQPKKARRYYEQALAARQKVLGNHPDTASSLNNLGLCLYEQGDYGAARPILERAVALERKLYGDNHRKSITALNNLGTLQQRQGDYADAKHSFDQALTISKKVNDQPNTAMSLSKLGYWFESQGDYAAARRKYEQALAIRRKLVGNNHQDTAICFSDLGGLLQHQGDFAAARPYLEQAVAINRRVYGDANTITANTLNNLGLLLHVQGDYAAARPYYEQALAGYNKILGVDHPASANTVNNLATLFMAQKDYAGARPYMEKALGIKKKALGNNHPDVATSLINLGVLFISQEDYAAARPKFEQALAICKQVNKGDNPDAAAALNNIGVLLLNLGEYDAARSRFDQALIVGKKVYGDNDPHVARTLNNLGSLHCALGDHARARSYYEQALKIQRTSLDLAAVALSERQQLAMNQVLREYLDFYLSLDPRAKVTAADSYQQVLAWKGAVALRQQQLRRVRQDPQLAPLAAELQAVCNRLANSSSALSGVETLADHRKLMADLTQKKEALEIKLAQKSEVFRKDKEAARLSPDQLRQVLPDDTALVDFLEYMHSEPDPKVKGELLGHRRLTGFVVRKNQPIIRVDLGRAQPIADAVESWRRLALRRSSFGSQDSDPGQILRRLVWQKIEPHLGGVKTVLLGPDGALAMLPFAALPGKKAGVSLLEEYNLAVMPLPRVLPRLLEEKNAGDPANSFLLAGDIDYDATVGKDLAGADVRTAARTADQRNLKFSSLPGTRGEILALQQTFEKTFPKGAVTLLRESQATEAALRQEAPRHRWLHVATHGFFAPPEVMSADRSKKRKTHDLFGKDDVVGFHPGLLSGLAFAGANRKPEPGQDDGILTALEVAELDLRKTELVVLSACETGLGKVAGGEGLLGLQRSFQLAGARTVVASLWSVPDEPTRILMERFYANLWGKKMTKLDALMEAQRWMLREGKDHPGVQRGIKRLDVEPAAVRDGRLPPYFWAAFVISGDWR